MLSNVARCAENMMTTTVVQALRAMAEVMHRMDPLQLHRLHLAPPCTVLQRVTPTDTDVVDITTIVTDMVADMVVLADVVEEDLAVEDLLYRSLVGWQEGCFLEIFWAVGDDLEGGLFCLALSFCASQCVVCCIGFRYRTVLSSYFLYLSFVLDVSVE